MSAPQGADCRHEQFEPGDVLRYVPDRHHCREGQAIVRDTGRAADTFWQTGSEVHFLTPAELATAHVEFNVNDYDALDRYSRSSRSTWATYHPDDRGRVTSQHGLQEDLFVRKGAKPDLSTQIANAQAKVEEAESALRSAEYGLERRREELAELRKLEGTRA